MSISRKESVALDREKRCECGQLIAKVQTDALQLKCKRCKRIVTIPFASIEGWTPLSPTDTALAAKS